MCFTLITTFVCIIQVLSLQAMSGTLKLYNTLTKKTEVFEPLHAPFVGMYLCGPTVYGYSHLGHARPAITFDILFRLLKKQNYKVRYVRNITDVGHLQGDTDDGEDKMLKKARLDQLEPMEVAQLFSDAYYDDLDQLNCWRPSIEPRATGHIPEQIEMIEKIIGNGFAYQVNGSVYFDVIKYSGSHPYGILSGRVVEELKAGAGNEARTLEGQEEKRNPADFALWKKAAPEHLMRWNSPWGSGFPGWHIECSAMSRKYLGEQFDIHGGGMDLLFPHHESEIAQSTACCGRTPAKYWIHNNMITINGQKMAKSLNNGILLQELFNGNHHLLEKAYSPMTLRFFILQAHYRSTLDFGNEALQAAEKGLARLLNAKNLISSLPATGHLEGKAAELKSKVFDALNEDLNTPIAIAHMFDGVSFIHRVNDGLEKISAKELEDLNRLFHEVIIEILGLKDENNNNDQILDGLIKLLLEQRSEAKLRKDFATSDALRNKLLELGVEVKDGKEGSTYSLKN